MVLWIIFAALTTVALVAVLWPLLRPGRYEISVESHEATVFRDQLDEIASEQDRGMLSDAEAEAARMEISRRLLAAAKPAGRQKAGAASARQDVLPTTALVCAFICIPLLSATLYLIYGSPGLPDSPLEARFEESNDSRRFEALVARVEARLREHPEDGRGWEVLAPVYLKQQRFEEAADAHGKALRLLGETPQRLSDYGNALVLANDGVVTEAARKVFQKAVTQDTSLVRAYFWLAMAREQDGRFDEAVAAWRDLLQRGDANAPWKDHVRERLALAEQRAGGSTGQGAAPGPEEEQAAATKKSPSREQVAAARDLKEPERAAMIERMVAGLAERLKNNGGTIEEWSRLIRSYSVLGKKEFARQALSDARGNFSKDSQALASLHALARSLGL